MPSGQEAFIKCRALPAKCLHRAFTSSHLDSKPWRDHWPDEEDEIPSEYPLKRFHWPGEMRNCRYSNRSGSWLKWTGQQLLRSGEKGLRQTGTVKNTEGKLAELLTHHALTPEGTLCWHRRFHTELSLQHRNTQVGNCPCIPFPWF